MKVFKKIIAILVVIIFMVSCGGIDKSESSDLNVLSNIPSSSTVSTPAVFSSPLAASETITPAISVKNTEDETLNSIEPSNNANGDSSGLASAGGVAKNSAYTALYFLDPKTGWAVNDHTLLKTDDGGASWSPISDYPGQITKLDFLNEDVGWAIETTGTNPDSCSILKTADGGKHWSSQYEESLPNRLEFSSFTLYCFDLYNGFAVLGNTLLKTSDGGDIWTSQFPFDNNFHLERMFFLDANNGWICGNLSGAAVIYRTMDNGLHWTQLWSDKDTQNFSGDITSISFINSTTGWILLNGADNFSCYLYQTTDEGISFHEVSYIKTSRFAEAADVIFRDDKTGWIFYGNAVVTNPIGGGLTMTNDGGKTFTDVDIDLSVIDAMAFPSADVGYAIGSKGGYELCSSNGGLIDTSDSGKTWRQLSEITPTNGISFVDKSNGYGIGMVLKDNAVLYTSDGGVSWSVRGSIPDTALSPVCISFVNMQIGFIICQSHEKNNSPLATFLYMTEDGGNSWAKIWNIDVGPPGYAHSPDYFRMFDRQNGIMGWQDTATYSVYRTNDGGVTWNLTAQDANGLPMIESSTFTSVEQGLILYFTLEDYLEVALYGQGTIGQPIRLSEPVVVAWFGAAMIGNKVVALAGYPYGVANIQILLSDDAGVTWKSSILSDSDSEILSRTINYYRSGRNLVFADQNNGFILVPGYSNLFFTEDGGNTWKWK